MPARKRLDPSDRQRSDKVDSFVSGTVCFEGCRQQLAEVLAAAGIQVTIGHWALRVPGLARTFELAYVGNVTPDAPFEVDGNGYEVPIERGCEQLADSLRGHRIGFDFAHFTAEQELIREYRFPRPT